MGHQGGRTLPVLHRRRRAGQPFRGEGPPGVIPGLLAGKGRIDHVDQKGQGADRHQQGADAAHLVDKGELGVVLGDPAGHAVETQPVLGGKAEVEADESEHEMEPAQGFIGQTPGELGIPVVDRAEDHKHRAAINDVVEVGDHEVGVVHVDVKGHLGQGYPGDAAEHEIEDEAAGKQHRRVKGDLAAPEGRQPVEELDAGGHGNQGGGDREKEAHPGGRATGEHVVGPHHQAQHHDRQDRVHHGDVAEQGLAGMGRQDLTNQAKGRQHHDVHRWVGIEPEQVLVHHGVAT